jgi:hypothetical protein
MNGNGPKGSALEQAIGLRRRAGNMQSLVLDLQREAMDHNVSVAQLLTKARVIAAKLGLADTEKWLVLELNGYREDDEVPKYRRVHGEVRLNNPVRGWQPIQMQPGPFADIFKERPLYQQLAEIEHVVNSETKGEMLTTSIPAGIKDGIYSGLNKPPYDVRYFVSRAQFVGIISAVRERIIEWTLTLEKNGILGEDMSFSTEEKQRVSEAQTIYNVNIENLSGVVGHVSSGATVNTAQTIQGVNPDDLAKLIANLRTILKDEQFDGRGEVDQDITKLDEEMRNGEPRKRNVVETLKKMLGPIGKAATFAGRVAAEHEIGSYLDMLPL